MFQLKNYVPILKWKMGEQKAVEELKSSAKENLTPLIEIMPVPETRKEVNIEEYITDSIDAIKECFTDDFCAFIDTQNIDDEDLFIGDITYMQYIFNYSRSIGLNLVPVISSELCGETLNCIININSNFNTGICYRLQKDDFIDADTILNNLVSDFSLEYNKVDIVLDFQYIDPGDKSSTLLGIVSTINSINNINEYRSLIFCATSFPKTIDVKRNSIGEIERTEWVLWKEIVDRKDKIKRIPVFGDYNISNPSLIEFDPQTMQLGGKIKYTHDDVYIIFKGSSFKINGREQMHNISKQVVLHAKYMGEDFSWGDEYIAKCSRHEVSKGNPTTWVKVGVNHHISFVTSQIASFVEI